MKSSSIPPFSFANQDQMPALGLGTWKSEPGEVYQVIREAIRIGYRHFDCAFRYENEAEIGTALAGAMADGEVSREELWITSKLWNSAHKKDHVAPALQETLDNLRLDYLDLYLMHWPVALKPGCMFPTGPADFFSLEEVPLIETWRGLEACAEKGLCRHLGVSNFSTKKIRELLPLANVKPEMNQVEAHPFLQQNALLAFCRENGIHLTAYAPLGSMDRPARVKNDDDPILFENKVIRQIAEEHQCTPAQVMIRWAMQRGTSVIPKSANPKRLRENFSAQFIELSPDSMQAIARLDRNHRYISGEFWTPKGSPYTLANLWDEG